MKYLIIDTNIPLSDANNIITLGSKDVTVVIPETVLAELDAKKSGYEEVNWQARGTARILSAAQVKSIDREDFGTITRLDLNGQELLIVGLNSYRNSPTEYGGNDQRIIEVAEKFTEFAKDDEVELMSTDFYMRLRALAIGVVTTDLKLIDDADFKFVKELEVEDLEVFRTLHNSDILSIDKDYKLEHYSYKFSNTETGQIKLATISNGFIRVLGKDIEKSLRLQDCPPINSEQLLASKAIQDPLIDLVMIEGQAGSGKNIVALSNAIRLLRTSRDKYTSILYVRTPQNDESPGEDIGYLSGNEEKYALYLGPMEDTIDFIVRQGIKQKGNEKRSEYEERVQKAIEALKEECKMESILTTGLRGRTLHNTIVIQDEWQNASQATAQKVLTRTGKNCKVIVTGSQNQIDSKYVTKYNNGLAVLMGEARERNITTDVNMFAIELTKVVRSEMALFAEELFTKKGK